MISHSGLELIAPDGFGRFLGPNSGCTKLGLHPPISRKLPLSSWEKPASHHMANCALDPAEGDSFGKISCNRGIERSVVVRHVAGTKPDTAFGPSECPSGASASHSAGSSHGFKRWKSHPIGRARTCSRNHHSCAADQNRRRQEGEAR